MLKTVLHSDFFLALNQFIFLEVLSVEYHTGPHEHHMTPPLSASPGSQVKTNSLLSFFVQKYSPTSVLKQRQ